MADHTKLPAHWVEQHDTPALIRAITLSSIFYILFLLLLTMKLFDPTQKLPLHKLLPQKPAPIKLLKEKIKQKPPEPIELPTPSKQAASEPIQPTNIIPSPPNQSQNVQPPTNPEAFSPIQPSSSAQPKAEPVKAPEKNLPERSTNLQKKETKAASINQKEEAIEEVRPKPRQKKSAWIRPALGSPKKTPAEEENKIKQTASKKITQGFAQFMEQKQKKMVFAPQGEDGYYWGQTAQENARKAEALSFFEHFLFSFCELSYQNQLSLKGIIARSHQIAAEITIDKNRTITKIQLIKPSPIPQLNNHINYLLSILTPPLFPAHHTEEEIIVPLNIQISMDTELKSLYFIPLKR